MRTKTIEIYQFEELSEDAQEKAIENERNSGYYLDYEWWDYTIDYWKEKLESIGFLDTEIQFTGFCSQGDGASFTAESIDIEKVIDSMIMCGNIDSQTGDLYLKKFNNVDNWSYGFSLWIERRNHHYSHEQTCRLTYENHGNEYWSNQIDKLYEDIESYRLDLCHAIYKSLETEYEYLMSDEQIKEHLTANEYEFTSNGEKY